MEEVIRIIEQIQNTSSKNEKLNIIKANADNELFKKTLRFLLDGNVVTGISKKKIGKKVSTEPVRPTPIDLGEIEKQTSAWESCMNYLEQNSTGTDNDIFAVQIFIGDQPEEHQELYTKMVTKTLKLGCDSKTVNKAIPGLIPTWEVQLGSSSEKLKLKKDEKFYLSKKMNGNRVSVIDGKFISRQGKEFSGMSHILSDIKTLGLEKWFLDGTNQKKHRQFIRW